mgnify:CR=1 FL=1
MKTLLAIILIGLSTMGFAQHPIEKNVGDFNEIKVFDLIEVNLIQSNENKVIIKGKDTEDVEIINKNGLLKIRMKLDKIFNGDETFVAVYYTHIDVIDGNEGAFIVSNELIKQDSITLKTQEGATIKVGLDVENLDTKAVTGGIVETRGRAKKQTVVLNTGGIYKGKDLETKQTLVKVQAGGEASVNASYFVDASVKVGGDIYIYGNPKQIDQKTTLGGNITQRSL